MVHKGRMLIASDTSQTLTCIPVLPGPQLLSQPVLSQQAWQYQYCQDHSYPLSQYSHSRPGSRSTARSAVTLSASTLTGLAVPVLPGPQLPSQPVLSQQAWQYQYCQAHSYPPSHRTLPPIYTVW